MTNQPEATDIGPLELLIRRLRGPGGCPWDQRQTLSDLRAYLLEEAHETAAAIDSGDLDAIAGELGDLLFQIVFIGELGREQKAFTLEDVVERIHSKMIDRHPHVFGDATLASVEDVQQAWETRKLDQSSSGQSVLAGVPESLPALVGAYRMTQKAAGVGFDWPDADSVLAKIREEVDECEEALAVRTSHPEAIREEIGDLLFSVANLARHLRMDPEAALAQSNRKFKRRFDAMAQRLEEKGHALGAMTPLEEMDAAWNAVKEVEKKAQTRS